MSKFICKILYQDLETKDKKVEYGLVEEEDIFSIEIPFDQHSVAFISVERRPSKRIVAIPVNLISEIRVFDEIDRIKPFSFESSVAEIC